MRELPMPIPRSLARSLSLSILSAVTAGPHCGGGDNGYNRSSIGNAFYDVLFLFNR
jgi:hypothetical protein